MYLYFIFTLGEVKTAVWYNIILWDYLVSEYLIFNLCAHFKDRLIISASPVCMRVRIDN